MAIATPESYADMLDRAKAGKYAIPAINVTSSQTLSAALQGVADAESDGIIQVSNGGAADWSGSSRADRVKGSLALSAYAYTVADLYPDACQHLFIDTADRRKPQQSVASHRGHNQPDLIHMCTEQNSRHIPIAPIRHFSCRYIEMCININLIAVFFKFFFYIKGN